MKKVRYLCLFLILSLVFSTVPAVAAADSAVQNGCHSVDAGKPLMPGDKLLETSKAVLVYERNSDTLIYGYNLDQKIYPASMVKLMTALVALEQGNLSDIVTVRRSALNHVAIGSVSADLKSGEELTLEALLYCMMAASANDAAVVIADHISGSQQRFVDLMNEKARDLGCTGTNFTNAHGLHDEQCYTTVRDVARILDAALDNETFKTMFQAKNYTVPATNKSEKERHIVTTNDMMTKENTSKYFDDRVTGGKTGATDQAGRCLAVTAEQNGMELLAIVMGAEPTYEVEDIILKTHGSFEEMAILLDHTFETYEYRQITFADQAVQQFPVSGGTNHVVVAPVSTVSAVLPVDFDKDQLSWVYGSVTGNLSAPIEKGQVLSALEVWYGDICVVQTDLVAMNGVEIYEAPVDATLPPEEGGDGGSTVLLVIGILFGVALAAAVVYAVIRAVRRAIVRSRRKRRRKEQRRRGNA